MNIKKVLGISALALSGAAAPVTFNADEGVFRLQEACGQATECYKAYNFICVGLTEHRDYQCSKGCEKPV